MQKEIKKIEVICFYLYIIWFCCWLGYYLRNKNPLEYDGIESFVAACINSGDHTWFPKKTCAALERNVVSFSSSKEDELNNRLSALETSDL
jgi:hypothetical protein